MLEARVGIEPTNEGFADPSLTTWLPRLRNECSTQTIARRDAHGQFGFSRGVRTHACRVGTHANTVFELRPKRRDESRRGRHECPRHTHSNTISYSECTPQSATRSRTCAGSNRYPES